MVQHCMSAAALFVANLMGLDLSLGQQLIVCATAMIASLGAPGIPSAGMVTMIMVLQSVGLLQKPLRFYCQSPFVGYRAYRGKCAG